jgi:hypothetical protein
VPIGKSYATDGNSPATPILKIRKNMSTTICH